MNLTNSITVLLMLLLMLPKQSTANYRHFHLDNADICNGGAGSSNSYGSLITSSSKTLNIGSGAAIITLSSPSSAFQPNYRNKAKRCEVHIKAPDEGHGLMAYVEEMHMRKSTQDDTCVDYVQFGQDDMVPFLTLSKSDKHCGEVNGKSKVDQGIFFDDPYGNLLVWVSLGGRRQTASWPSISVVNLTLVVTAYQKDCAKPRQNYKRCRERDRCVWAHYFCDRHFNCPKDLIPADEDGCVYEELTTTWPTGGGGAAGGAEDDSGLNFVSVTLITVCSAIIVMLVMVLVLKYRRHKRCCFSSRASSPDQDDLCRDPSSNRRAHQARSLAELHRTRHLRETESNLYLPLTTYLDQNRAPRGPTVVVETTGNQQLSTANVTAEEEAPPAYDELFPTAVQATATVTEDQTVEAADEEEAVISEEVAAPAAAAT